ncbi:hypothetical protein NHQ30_000172 [Ciborinia camelliae]|nr:hypothetical protein NHQ30_000172 [Ciborinia camelliae]
MMKILGSQSDDSFNDIYNHHVTETGGFCNDEDGVDEFDGFDFDNHNNNIQNSAPSSPEESNLEGITVSISDIELADDTMALTFSQKFDEFPEELQMNIWKFTALHIKRTIVMKLGQNTFEFGNCPPTPAFMHVCHRARKYGLEIFKAVNARGVSHNIADRRTFGKFYFYINPFGDDFVLRFGEEKNCPMPVYCPIESSSSYMRLDLKAAESELQEEHELLVLERQRPHQIPLIPFPIMPIQAPGAPPATLVFAFIPIGANHPPQGAAQHQAGQAPPRPQPGEPVFPPSNRLPEFFTNIRAVGINLDLSFSPGFDFSQMSPISLRNWAKDTIKTKFDIVFKEILNQFPNLEYAFAVIRAHGRSNQDFHRGVECELDKKKWTDVGMAKGEGMIMGYDEFRQLESQAKYWFMMERIDRGMNLNKVDFELYVQRNIQWEI